MKKVLFLLTALIMLTGIAACSSPAQDDAQQTEPANTESLQDTEAEEETQNTSENAQQPEQDSMPEGAKLTNILLIGSMDKDFSKDDADAYMLTHILITLDPQNATLKFTTFPYNLGLDVENDGTTQIMQPQFICSRFGEDETVNVFEENFGIDIDYWVVMNMNGVIDIVDAVEGIEINIEELTINEAAEHLVDMLGIVWSEITQTGKQILSGVQTAGYFVDTVQENNDNWLQDEELIFRDRHSNIIKGIIAAVKLAGLTSEDLMTIAANVKSNYATNIPESKWQTIADIAIYCLENDAQFLHVPEVIDTQQHDGMPPMIYDKEKDVTAVQTFTGK